MTITISIGIGGHFAKLDKKIKHKMKPKLSKKIENAYSWEAKDDEYSAKSHR